MPPADGARDHWRRAWARIGIRSAWLLTLVVSVALVGCSSSQPPPGDALRHPNPDSLQAAAVRHVIAGDTLDVEVEGREIRVRLYGIDTPERGEPCEREATGRLRTLAGDTVRLREDARLQDPNGRALRYVYTEDGHSIDATMLAEGLAEAWTADGSLRDALVAIEEEARRSGTGCLWGR